MAGTHHLPFHRPGGGGHLANRGGLFLTAISTFSPAEVYIVRLPRAKGLVVTFGVAGREEPGDLGFQLIRRLPHHQVHPEVPRHQGRSAVGSLARRAEQHTVTLRVAAGHGTLAGRACRGSTASRTRARVPPR